MRIQRINSKDFLKKNWLLSGILFCVCLAALYPKLGSKEGKDIFNKTVGTLLPCQIFFRAFENRVFCKIWSSIIDVFNQWVFFKN